MTVLMLFFITSHAVSGYSFFLFLYVYPWIYHPPSPVDMFVAVGGIWLKTTILLGVLGVSAEALSYTGWFLTGQLRRGGLRHEYGYPMFRIYWGAFNILAAMLGKLSRCTASPNGRSKRKGDTEYQLRTLFGRFINMCLAPGWSAHTTAKDPRGSIQNEGRSKKKEE